MGALSGVHKNMTRGIVALVFRGRVIGSPPLTATAEALRVEWLPVAGLSRTMSEAYAIRLTDAINPEHAQVRSHDGTHVDR